MRPGHLSLDDPADAGAEDTSAMAAAASVELQAEELKLRARALAREQLQTVQRMLQSLSELSGAASRGDLPLGVR